MSSIDCVRRGRARAGAGRRARVSGSSRHPARPGPGLLPDRLRQDPELREHGGLLRRARVLLPEANAFFVSRLELWGGLLLVVGLATRLVALGLASTMVVALATADRATFLDALRGTGDAGLTDVVPFVYLLFLGWLILAGPGLVSLDTLVARRLDRPPRLTTPV